MQEDLYLAEGYQVTHCLNLVGFPGVMSNCLCYWNLRHLLSGFQTRPIDPPLCLWDARLPLHSGQSLYSGFGLAEEILSLNLAPFLALCL